MENPRFVEENGLEKGPTYACWFGVCPSSLVDLPCQTADTMHLEHKPEKTTSQLPLAMGIALNLFVKPMPSCSAQASLDRSSPWPSDPWIRQSAGSQHQMIPSACC